MHTDSYFDHLSVCDNDFEIISKIIAMVIPETDQVGLSHHLSEHYINIPSLLSTTFTTLRSDNRIGDNTAHLLKYIHILLNRYNKSKLRNKDLVTNIADLNHYLLNKMPALSEEQILLFILDAKNYLIREELMARGIFNEVFIHPATIIKKIIESDAAAFILVHNHPSGDPQPSQRDVMSSTILSDLCDQLSITFHDHIIVGADRLSSMRNLGLL